MSRLHMFGFGSQGMAWAQCLRDSGWDVRVYLGRDHGLSFERATELGFKPAMVGRFRDLISKEKPGVPQLVAMLTPDQLIAPLYREFIAPALPGQALTLVLAHGYAVYARELAGLVANHEAALLAPKAIGPKLRATYLESSPHRLVAGYHASDERDAQVKTLAYALGFREENLVRTSFEKEAIGDLISEQALLCGGVFNLLEWTMEAMQKAGVPPRLIREECLTELELVAGMLRSKGPAETFAAISQAAQCGTVTMGEKFKALGLDRLVAAAAEEVVSGKFVETMRSSDWPEKARALKERLAAWEYKLADSKTQTTPRPSGEKTL